MFKASDIRVAVENAKPEVKAAADYICAANYNDGVVHWYRRKLSSKRKILDEPVAKVIKRN